MDELTTILTTVISKLRAAVRSDQSLRSELRRLAELLLSLTEPQADVGLGDSADDAESARATVGEKERGEKRLLQIDPSQIQIGSLAQVESGSERQVRQWAPPMADLDDLPWIEKRLTLKAEASRWAGRRLQLLDEGVDFQTEIDPQDRDIIARAKKLPDCFLWMCNPQYCPTVGNPSEFDDLASCFDVSVSAVELLRKVTADSDVAERFLDPTLHLAAEAQSMLLAAIDRIGAKQDSDQVGLFKCLRGLAYREQIFVQRYMSRNDAADPTAWKGLQDRIDGVERELDQTETTAKQRRSHFNKIRYHLKRIREKPDEPHLHDWQTVVDEVDKLVVEGLPPSNVELRDMLAPLVDNVPVSVRTPDGTQLVFREIDRYLSLRPAQRPAPVSQTPSPAVTLVASLLAGRALLMIGGEPRPQHKAALERAFGLSELAWLKTSEQNPRLDCEGDVARPDVAAVLLAIRWSRHCFEDVKTLCEKHAKPLVHLPAGYNPNQVAEQILAQCSDRLAERWPPSGG